MLTFVGRNKVVMAYAAFLVAGLMCIIANPKDGFAIIILSVATLPSSLIGWLQILILPGIWLPRFGGIIVLSIASMLNILLLHWLLLKIKKKGA